MNYINTYDKHLIKLFIQTWHKLDKSHKFCVIVCRDEDWQDNDGALNTISMTHPRLPIEHPNHCVEKESDCHPMQPGIWLVKLPPYSLVQ